MTQNDAHDAAPPYRVMSSVLFSADGQRAVLLRRGPRLHHRLIVWTLADDTFQHGQWMKGTVHLCDLNFRGDKLIYWARQFHASAPRLDAGDPGVYRPYGLHDWRHVAVPEREAKRRGRLPRANEGVWTAVSTPPYFSAFAIWPALGHWTGGGVFSDDATIALQETESGLRPKVNMPLPKALRVTRLDIAPMNWPRFMAHRPNGGEGGAIEAALQAGGVRWVDWVHTTRSGTLLFGADGCLYRLRRWRDVPLTDLLRRADRVIDLTPLRFEQRAAPAEAFHWPLMRATARRAEATPRVRRMRRPRPPRQGAAPPGDDDAGV